MIPPHATFEVRRIPLSDIVLYEHQSRYPERLLHYISLMHAHPDQSPGFVSVHPTGDGRYALDDGHHRLCAHIMTGRSEILAVIVRTSDECNGSHPIG